MISRRDMLATLGSSLLLAGAPRGSFAADDDRRLKVAVIGHTGRGNYGHGLDVVWQQIAGAHIVGVADADPRGLAAAAARLKPERTFADYRELLAATRPEFVSIAPRFADEHGDMLTAAIAAGVRGIYVEKPFCRTPAEADQILHRAAERGTRIAVAHRNRYHPALPVVTQCLADGEIGELLELRGHGLGDRRGGGEDLWVLGSHVVNLMHHFGGTPTSCAATILHEGRLATRDDVRDGAEGLGPLVGTEIHARWLFPNGVTGSYTTLRNDGSNKSGYGLQLVGTRGTLQLLIDKDPFAWLWPGNPFDPAQRSTERIPVSSAGVGRPEPHPETVASVANHRVAVDDLIAAVQEQRAPLCSAQDGATTVEMICGVFASFAAGGGQIALPLARRTHPLQTA